MLDPAVRCLLIDSGKIEPNEIFYPLTCYEHLKGKYGISPLGKVYSVRTKRIMKSRVNKPHKYLYISLGSHEAKKTVSIHRLVALHFVPNLDKKREVHHIDGNPLNNAYWNLQWVTGDENQAFHQCNVDFMKDQRRNRDNN